MFHFPALPPAALSIQAAATAHDGRRVSPFGHPRITAWLPAPRGLSQAPTSFLGSWCQGIHRVPLKTWRTTNRTTEARCSRPLCSSQETDRNQPPPGTTRRGNRPATRKTRPHGRSLRTQQRARPAPAPGPPFRSPRRDSVLTGPGHPGWANSQHSTRKHGHPASQTLTEGARCSLERR
jgi:hypothetical protein